MRKLSILVATVFVALNAVGAEADALHKLHSRIHHAPAMAGYAATYPYAAPAHQRRAPATPPWAVYPDYKSVGLSDNPDDCNSGCALSNGS